MFIGRERELSDLERAYKDGGFQMVAVYGRRRVGKTALLHRFVSDKENVCYFTALRTTARENLDGLSAALAQETTYPDNDLYPGAAVFPEAYPVYRSFAEAFAALFRMAQRERIIFVIDEYPYLAESYPGISSLLQKLIDENKQSSRLFLVLCGSSMSFMEEQVLGEKSPLYGRRTLQMKLDPFDAFDAAQLLGNPDSAKAVEFYALAGGVPLYLEQLDARRSVAWNIANRLLAPSSILSNEVENLLLQEVRSPSSYNAIVEAIARGCVRPQEISDRTGIKSPLVQQCLSRLERLAIVRRTEPVGHHKKNQVRYVIADNLFRFHYRFGIRYRTAVESGLAEAAARRIVSDDLSTFVGPVFEEVCRQWLMRQVAGGELDMIPVEMGSWWGTNPVTRQEEEVDVVVRGVDGELVIGECKWNNAPVDASVLGTLRRRAALFGGGENTQLYLFARNGFDEACRERARRAPDVHLVALGEMFGCDG
ncbi:ATP-binding protein [Olsenella profusa]|nr:ATP-binding protein [Olsenella profusa]